jgi:sortase A
VDVAVVEGVDVADLRKGPGHYPTTVLPGEDGNAAVAGHRTTYGAPFNRLDELAPGDEIAVETVKGSFTYVVEGTRVVAPSDVSVVAATDDDRITLTTCNPKYSARERLVVTGRLRGDPVAPPPAAEEEAPRTSPVPLDDLDAGTEYGVAAVRGGTFFWAFVVALVGLVWAGAVHSRRHWVSWVAPVAPFLLVLFFFFGEVERLLPAGY